VNNSNEAHVNTPATRTISLTNWRTGQPLKIDAGTIGTYSKAGSETMIILRGNGGSTQTVYVKESVGDIKKLLEGGNQPAQT
jgi:hypothetical protein